MPKVSVVIATHNNENTVARAVVSALVQTVADIEILIVNDASTDRTAEVVAHLAADDHRIRYVDLAQNIGAGGARNVALAMAAGEWITLLDGDDWYDPVRLEVLLRAAYHYNADLVADNIKIFDHQMMRQMIHQTNYGERGRVAKLTAEAFFKRDNSLQEYPIGNMQPLIRREFLLDNKLAYNETYRVGEDFLFEAEVLLYGARAFIVPGAYYNYVFSASPTNKRVAPDSHSNVPARLSMLIRGCNELLAKYGHDRMSSEARNAVMFRLRLLESSVRFRDLRIALRRLKLLRALGIVIGDPLVLILICHNIKELFLSNVSALTIKLGFARIKVLGANL